MKLLFIPILFSILFISKNINSMDLNKKAPSIISSMMNSSKYNKCLSIATILSSALDFYTSDRCSFRIYDLSYSLLLPFMVFASYNRFLNQKDSKFVSLFAIIFYALTIKNSIENLLEPDEDGGKTEFFYFEKISSILFSAESFYYLYKNL